MQTLGQILRENRAKKGLLLRQVSAVIEVDKALISKYERDERQPSREQVIQFAKLFQIETRELLIAWLSDKIASEVQGEDFAMQALKAAEKKVDIQSTKAKSKL